MKEASKGKVENKRERRDEWIRNARDAAVTESKVQGGRMEGQKMIIEKGRKEKDGDTEGKRKGWREMKYRQRKESD